jgi:TorA maturation chaperone TorD
MSRAEPDEPAATLAPAAFHAAYRVLSTLFLPPEQNRLATVVTAVPELRSIVWPLSNLSCGPAFDRVLKELERLEDEDVERLGSDHAALFLSGSRDHAVQPYESWHVGVDGYAQPAASAELSARYRAAGLAVGIAGELPDHIAVELEFCAYLCHQEGDAGTREERQRWQRERRTFLIEHPLRWFAAFEDALQASMARSLYVGFARAARAVAADDRMLLDILLSNGAGVVG